MGDGRQIYCGPDQDDGPAANAVSPLQYHLPNLRCGVLARDVESWHESKQLFTERKVRNEEAATPGYSIPHTIAAYRDAFRLLLQFASERFGRVSSKFRIEDRTWTRNNHLAALHAFFQNVSIREPAVALHCQRVLANPVETVRGRPRSRSSQREQLCNRTQSRHETRQTLLLVAAQTGLRNIELASLRRPGRGVWHRRPRTLFWKGCKMPCTALRPTRRNTQRIVVRDEHKPDDPMFPSSGGWRMSADALQRLLAKHVVTTRKKCPSLSAKKVTSHKLRHGTAVALLRRGSQCHCSLAWP